MRRIKVIVVVGVLALAFVASACEPTPPPPPPTKSVVLVGDSISNVASEQLGAVFGTLFNWRFSMYAQGGAAVVDLRSAIRDRAAFEPDVMVIALGTNDMGGVNAGKPPAATQNERYARALAEMRGAMDDLAGVRCVVWIDVNTWSRVFDDTYDLRTWGPRYDAQLRIEAAARPNVHIVDFANQILAKGLPWMAANFDQIVVHPESVEGKQTVAAIMAQGVRDHCDI